MVRSGLVLLLALLLVPAAAPPAGAQPAGGGPTAPVALRVPALGVEAGVEALAVVGGAMQAPAGPWAVGWYPDFGAPGGGGNTVLAGHVDYAGVGPAVFAGLGGLGAGAEVVVAGADGRWFTYAVAWAATYELAALTAADLAAILGAGGGEALTLITCGGAWDAAAGAYTARTVVRAALLGASGADPAAAPAPAPGPPDDGTGGPARLPDDGTAGPGGVAVAADRRGRPGGRPRRPAAGAPRFGRAPRGRRAADPGSG